MQRRIVKVTNRYDGTEKFAIQWRLPILGWWFFYHDSYYGGRILHETYDSCEESLMQKEKSESGEIITVVRN
jgi:hypothetical protein